MLTDNDMETLKKDYNLNNLLLPKSEIILTTELGKGILTRLDKYT